jgi:hypothetical protein
MLVLLMGFIYEVRRWDGLRCHDTHSKFRDDWVGHTGNIKVKTSTIWEAAMLVLLSGTVYGVGRWDGLRWYDILRTKCHKDW